MMTGKSGDCKIHSMEALPDDITAQTATVDAVVDISDIADLIGLAGGFESPSNLPLRDPEVQLEMDRITKKIVKGTHASHKCDEIERFVADNDRSVRSLPLGDHSFWWMIEMGIEAFKTGWFSKMLPG
jgi:hypothetical protein